MKTITGDIFKISEQTIKIYEFVFYDALLLKYAWK